MTAKPVGSTWDTDELETVINVVEFPPSGSSASRDPVGR